MNENYDKVKESNFKRTFSENLTSPATKAYIIQRSYTLNSFDRSGRKLPETPSFEGNKKVRCFYKDQVQFVQLPEESSYESLVDRVRHKFDLFKPFKIVCKMELGEIHIIQTQQDLEECKNQMDTIYLYDV